MEKLLRRSILNRNQLVNKNRRESAKDIRKTWRDYNRLKNLKDTQMNHIIKSERIARREDWIMGPLAPKRDAGTNKKTYGAVDHVLAQGPKLPSRELKWPRGKGYDAYGSEDKRMPGFEDGEWKGVGLRGNLVVGDRVAVMKGTLGVQRVIGEVIQIERQSEMVTVKGVNKVDFRVPAQAAANANGAKIFDREIPIHISDLCLTTQLTNSQTGVEETVIIRQVHGGAPYIQRPDGSNHPRHTRYITGGISGSDEDIPLAWPEDDPDRAITQPGDTTRDLVEQVTYTPSFGDGSVVPDGVVDELRKKHARSRRDFDDIELMKRKLLEDARRDWFAERSKVLSQPFWTKDYILRERRAREEKTRELLDV